MQYSAEDARRTVELLDLWARLEAAERGMRRLRRRTALGSGMPSPGWEHL